MNDLEILYQEHAARVRAYAWRHVGPDSADDVVSEVFLVAGRRLSELPDGVGLPWLLVVARNLIANQRRSGRRADELWEAAVREQWHRPLGSDPADVVSEREQHLRALSACTRPEREALLLIAWEGLTHEQAAAVAGCSVRALTVRLSRARARLQAALDDTPCISPTRTLHLAQEPT